MILARPRTERRTVRPFVSIDDALSDVRLRVRPDAEFEDGPRLEIDDSQEAVISPGFSLQIDETALKALEPLDLGDFAVVIRVSDARLHRSAIVFGTNLANVPREWRMPRSIADSFAWRYGLRLTVAVVLSNDRSPQPGEPRLRGHWVARKDFIVRERARRSAFQVENWPPERFAELGLPRNTAYWLGIEGADLNANPEEVAETLRIAFRSDVFNALAANEGSPKGDAPSSCILAEIVTDIMMYGIGDLAEGDSVDEHSVLGGLLERIARSAKIDRDKLINMARENLRPRVRAFVQDALGTRKALAKLKSAA